MRAVEPFQCQFESNVNYDLGKTQQRNSSFNERFESNVNYDLGKTSVQFVNYTN